MDKNVNKLFDEMLMFVCVLRFVHIPCTTSSGLAQVHLRGAEQDTSCSARRSSPKGMVVSETFSGKNAKREVAPIGQISRRDKS
ncbi:hypothetical protein B296_00029967 [Ensete ventricosum]|uniref:Uncharacterized protein n=1 Tax=Ensete ventricosum TaxID=4639 RepID=A0A426Y129_ENSVE|nr:hypothetical protein B296_00029967 [Ensete ventricosum]